MLILVSYDHFGASNGRAAIFSVFSRNLGCPEMYFWMLEGCLGSCRASGGCVFTSGRWKYAFGAPGRPQDTPRYPKHPPKQEFKQCENHQILIQKCQNGHNSKIYEYLRWPSKMVITGGRRTPWNILKFQKFQMGGLYLLPQQSPLFSPYESFIKAL